MRKHRVGVELRANGGKPEKLGWSAGNPKEREKNQVNWKEMTLTK